MLQARTLLTRAWWKRLTGLAAEYTDAAWSLWVGFLLLHINQLDPDWFYVIAGWAFAIGGAVSAGLTLANQGLRWYNARLQRRLDEQRAIARIFERRHGH